MAKLTEEQRAEIAKITDVKVFDEDHVHEIIQDRDKVKERIRERDTELEEARQQAQAAERELEELRKKKALAAVSETNDDETERRLRIVKEQHEIELREARQEADQLRSTTIKQERNLQIRSAVAGVAEFESPEDVISLVDKYIKTEIKDGRIITTIIDDNGRRRYGDDGTDLTIEGLVKEVAKKKPYLIKGYRSGGSGAPGGNGAQGTKLSDRDILAGLNVAYDEAIKQRDTKKAMEIENQRAQYRAKLNPHR